MASQFEMSHTLDSVCLGRSVLSSPWKKYICHQLNLPNSMNDCSRDGALAKLQRDNSLSRNSHYVRFSMKAAKINKIQEICCCGWWSHHIYIKWHYNLMDILTRKEQIKRTCLYNRKMENCKWPNLFLQAQNGPEQEIGHWSALSDNNAKRYRNEQNSSLKEYDFHFEFVDVFADRFCEYAWILQI